MRNTSSARRSLQISLPWPQARIAPPRGTPHGPQPSDQVVAFIDALSHRQLGQLVECLIDRMDALDGDTDLEPNGDESDGNLCEDEFR